MNCMLARLRILIAFSFGMIAGQSSSFGQESWYNRIVPAGTIFAGGYTHGQWPTLDRPPTGVTHPGIDIGGECGVDELHAWDSGVVERIVNDRSNANFPALGYAVMLFHPHSELRTVYFHLASAPADREGSPLTEGAPVAAGDRIGIVGKTGAAMGCHVHFEIRKASFGSEWFNSDPRWRYRGRPNIYGEGDLRDSAILEEYWLAPDTLPPALFIGDWVGQMNQPGFAPFSVAISIVNIEESQICGRIDHADLQCSGRLVCLSATGSRLVAVQTIEVGRDRCLDGQNQLVLEGDRITRIWVNPSTGQEGARGLLSRNPQP